MADARDIVRQILETGVDRAWQVKYIAAVDHYVGLCNFLGRMFLLNLGVADGVGLVILEALLAVHHRRWDVRYRMLHTFPSYRLRFLPRLGFRLGLPLCHSGHAAHLNSVAFGSAPHFLFGLQGHHRLFSGTLKSYVGDRIFLVPD